MKLYRKEYYIVFFLTSVLFIGLVSNFTSYFNNNLTPSVAIFADSIVFFKAFVAYFAVRLLSNVYNSENVLLSLSKYSERIFLLLLLFIIADFIFKIYPREYRFGLRSIELFFQHTSRYAFTFSFIFLVLLPSHFNKKKGFLLFVLLAGMLSLRVKYLGFVVVTILIIFYGKKLFKISKFYFLAFTVSLGLILAWFFWDWLAMYFTFTKLDNTAWSRAVILYYSFIIGNDYFPIGTGFGTYASYYSGLYYSWVYDLYGISNVYGIKRTHWKFVSDQYWPMVLGQFGYFGLMGMLLVIYNYFSLFMGHIKFTTNRTKYFRFISIVLGLMLLLIDSTTDAIFTQQRAVVMFIYFALIINTTMNKNENTTDKQIS
ncbi:hypothetical protein [uncultured Winogradskyella sp.]|uniref:hypothetical protein n=1 Tax=uncultured Winogradskyella sp. TaxID=395353 RepID=UPI002616CF15|nr:hypothetical protein [uncultured Winogradskyella sp.]